MARNIETSFNQEWSDLINDKCYKTAEENESDNNNNQQQPDLDNNGQDVNDGDNQGIPDVDEYSQSASSVALKSDSQLRSLKSENKLVAT